MLAEPGQGKGVVPIEDQRQAVFENDDHSTIAQFHPVDANLRHLARVQMFTEHQEARIPILQDLASQALVLPPQNGATFFSGWNRLQSPSKATFGLPFWPWRFLATMISAVPLRAGSSLYSSSRKG